VIDVPSAHCNNAPDIQPSEPPDGLASPSRLIVLASHVPDFE
jgi:hypothetical protein